METQTMTQQQWIDEVDAVGLDWTRPGGHRIARLVRQAPADVPAGQLRFASAWAAAPKRGDEKMIDALLEFDGTDDLVGVDVEVAWAAAAEWLQEPDW